MGIVKEPKGTMLKSAGRMVKSKMDYYHYECDGCRKIYGSECGGKIYPSVNVNPEELLKDLDNFGWKKNKNGKRLCNECSGKKKEKTFLCIEDGERFTIEAKDMKDAREQASTWNAEVIEEIREKAVN